MSFLMIPNSTRPYLLHSRRFAEHWEMGSSQCVIDDFHWVSLTRLFCRLSRENTTGVLHVSTKCQNAICLILTTFRSPSYAYIRKSPSTGNVRRHVGYRRATRSQVGKVSETNRALWPYSLLTGYGQVWTHIYHRSRWRLYTPHIRYHRAHSNDVPF